MNLTIEKTMARMSNAGDSARSYNVSGTVYRSTGGFEAVRDGQVQTKDGGTQLAWFNSGVNEPLAINFASVDTAPAEQTAIIADIQAFIAAAKAAGE